MKCFAQYSKENINCQLCERIKDSVHAECKQKTKEKNNIINYLKKIRETCKYHGSELDEYTSFDSCSLNGNGLGRFADNCKPTLECEKYCR